MTYAPIAIDQLGDLSARAQRLDEQLRRGHRITWLAGAGLFALQRRHHCRDGNGRFVPCRSACPDWDDIWTSPRPDIVVEASRRRGALSKGNPTR